MTLTLPILTRRRHGVLTDAQRVAQLFASGAQGAWYDPSDYSTLYQDAAGTTPVTAVEQPVRLMLDRSKGLVLGSELVSNGDFSSGTTGWTGTNATISEAAGVATVENSGATAGAIHQTLTTVSGRRYVVNFSVASFIGASTVRASANNGGSPSYNGTQGAANYGVGTHTFAFVAAGTTTVLAFYVNSTTVGHAFTIDNISVRELPGNHAVAPNDASRPVLRARYNLLTRSEEFDNGVWALSSATITANAAAAPNGTTTADKLVENTADATHQVSQGSIAYQSGTVYTATVYARTTDARGLRISGPSAAFPTASRRALFDLTNGTVISNESGTTASITNAGGGWWRCSLTMTSNASATGSLFFDLLDASNAVTYTGDGTSGIYIWGAQLQTAADHAATGGAYQRVGAATDYDTGPPWRPYLAFDGSDDSMSTSAIDFATVTSDGQPRRNLLVNPTQFDAAVWAKNNVTVTANAAVAPDGTLTADLLTTTSVAVNQGLVSVAGQTAFGVYSYTVFVKQGTASGVTIQPNGNWDSTNHGATLHFTYATKTITSGVYGTGITINSTSAVELANGWFRLSIIYTTSGTTPPAAFNIWTYARLTTVDTTANVSNYFWGAQLETGSTATEFQNIGTDKMTVFAGVTKLSDAATAVVAELSANSQANNGSFDFMTAVSGADYRFRSVGTASAAALSAASYAAPITNVLTGIGDISGDVATLRVNGVQAATSATDQGTGNFGNYPLFIGRRNNTNLPFNGRLYGLTVLGRTATAEELAHTERTIAIASGFSAPTFSGDLNIGIS